MSGISGIVADGPEDSIAVSMKKRNLAKKKGSMGEVQAYKGDEIFFARGKDTQIMIKKINASSHVRIFHVTLGVGKVAGRL